MADKQQPDEQKSKLVNVGEKNPPQMKVEAARCYEVIIVAKSLASSGKTTSRRAVIIICPLKENQRFKSEENPKSHFPDRQKTLPRRVFYILCSEPCSHSAPAP